ncbi:hypothetical protein IAT40_001969 [Kwoniella sp. CBS 6097]
MSASPESSDIRHTTISEDVEDPTAVGQEIMYKPRFRRSRTGCLRCRKGKHKCDEEKPVCRRCRHSKGECIWPILRQIRPTEKSISPEEGSVTKRPEGGERKRKRRRKQAAETSKKGDAQALAQEPRSGTERITVLGDGKELFSPLNEEQMIGQASDFAFDYDSEISRVTRAVNVGTSYGSSEGLQQDSMTLIGTQGGSDGHGKLVRMPKEPLALVFPDDHERELMHHLLCFGNIVLYAVPRANQPIQYLNLAQCLANRRETSIETDAVLLSLLSVAAVHRSSIIMQQEHRYLTSPPVGRWGSPKSGHLALIAESGGSDTFACENRNQVGSKRQEGEGEYRRAVGDQFARLALDLCKTGVLLKLSPGGSSFLANTVSIIISQALNGGRLWQEAYITALNIIKARGGPLRMVKSAQRKSETELHRVRTLLENLVIVDVCWCLASGSAPTLMTEAFAPWWFDFVVDNEDTVHNSYGVDRGVIEMLNRVNMLVHERRLLITALDPNYLHQHLEKVHDLLLELSVWENDLQKADVTGRPARVALGNTVLIHTIKMGGQLIVLHVDLLNHPHSHPEVQASAKCAIGNLGRSSKTLAVVALLLPAIISGSMMFDEEGRDRVRKAIIDLRSTVAFAFDVEEAFNRLNKGSAFFKDTSFTPYGIKRIKERVGYSPVYLTIDIDTPDPAFAPATGTPEIGGWTTREMIKILHGLKDLKIVGADVVEVAPSYDTTAEITQIAAAGLVFELLSMMALTPVVKT